MRLFKTKSLLILMVALLTSCSQNIKKNESANDIGYKHISREKLIKYKPKRLLPSQTKKIQSMLEVRSTGLGILSENGKSLYFGWNVTGQPQIWKTPGPKKFPTQMTGGQDSSYLSSISADGKHIYISRDSKGNEYPGLYRQKTSGGPLELIYYKKNAKTSLAWVDRDNKHIYYKTNDIDPKNFTIYKYNLESKKREVILNKKGYWFLADKFIDGTLLVGLAKTNIVSEYYTLSESSKTLKPVVGQNEFNKFSVKFAPLKDSFFVLTDKFDDFNALYLFKNGKYAPITNTESDISYFKLDRPRRKLIYGINDKGYNRVEVLNTSTLKKLKTPIFKNAISTYYGYTTRNGRYTSIGVINPTSPRTNYVYDWKKEKLTQWTNSSNPEIDTSYFVQDSLEYYKAQDGTMIPMFVKRPKHCHDKTCPVIVSFHGGPESQARASFSPYSQLFIDEGFIYVRPNVRGSSGYGKKWLHSDNGAKRLNVISDIKDCATYIKQNWNKTGTPKVGIMGGSYGGYSTLIGMTMFAGSYEAGAASVGMSSLVTFLKNTAPFRRKLRESEYGFLNKDLEALEKLSPINYIDKIQDPILILHGANDPRVPVGESVQIKEILDDKGVAADLIIFSNEGHGIRKRKNKVIGIGHTIDFFKKHLIIN